MGDYDIYYKRLNRYGYDYQSRIQSERERNFDNYLLKSVYRVDFRYNGEVYEGTLERNTEDVTQTTSYLLTRTRDTIPGGTILFIPGFKGERLIPWLVWYQLEREAKGYNKYMMLKMNYNLVWRDNNGEEYNQWVYFRGLSTEPIRDKVRSTTRVNSTYLESTNLHMFITQFNPNLQRDNYFEIEKDGVTLAYWITEIDMVSTPGVMYCSVDQRHKIDFTPAPAQTPQDNPDDFYWLTGEEEQSNG